MRSVRPARLINAGARERSTSAWPGARARQRARRLDAGRQRRQPLKLRGSPHRRRSFQGPVHVTSGIIEDVTVGLEQLARTAYEAHRGANPDAIPPWEDSSEQEQQAWKAAVSAVAGQTGVTLADAVPAHDAGIETDKLRIGEQRREGVDREVQVPVFLHVEVDKLRR